MFAMGSSVVWDEMELGFCDGNCKYEIEGMVRPGGLEGMNCGQFIDSELEYRRKDIHVLILWLTFATYFAN